MNQCSVSQFKYLSHTGGVATSETASATEGTTTAHSIVISPRVGPLDRKQPKDVIVHLLCLETIEGRPAGSIKDHVALISLHSWTYTALPPESPDSRTSLQEIGRSIKVLRTIDTPQDSDGQTCDSIDNIMAKRQRDGYYLIRYKTITGEETAGMFRGPLVPRVIPKVFSTDGCIQSNSGTHLQILDPRTSLMDLSYSSAWQLGRTLAMDDLAFVTAPSRLRARIHAKASGTSKQGKPLGSRTTQTIVPSGVGDLISELENLNHNLDASTTSTVSSNRWKRETPPTVDSLDGGKERYDTLENSTDYAIVQEWVFDRLCLQGIPAQYFIPDSSFLPAETLRFFYIDTNWTESLIDGALSLGNQSASEPTEDFARSSIKEMINMSMVEPIPTFSVLMRSRLLSEFPDLTVSATVGELVNVNDDAKPKAPILVQRMLAENIMLVLLDRTPPELKSVQFTLPLHHQTFSIGTELTNEKLVVDWSPIYKDARDVREKPKKETILRPAPEDPPTIFDWDSRCINIEAFANATWENLRERSGEDKSGEHSPSSSMMALQLSEPVFMLDIVVSSPDAE